jgi:hypothetical protein
MGEALTDFIKNAGLVTLLHFSVTGILFLVSLGFLLSAPTRRQMSWFLGIGILPALSGILAMYFKNRVLDTGRDAFGPLGPEAIAAGRREALINLGVGVAGTTAILALRAWCQRLNRKQTKET